ncbi:MAG: cellulase family glycosylhydrolase [Deltaproteobacteria bacterium]|nr:cellulase family glycosylhydrolase [Deltaproteobacteria bacterium]
MRGRIYGRYGMVFVLALLCLIGVACADGSDGDNDSNVDDDMEDDDAGDDDVSDDDADDDTWPPLPDDDATDDDTDNEDWKYIRDEQGRALILHGCNFDGNAKGESGLPNRTEQEALDFGAVYGFNFMRYLIFWARIEEQQGVYNDAYLDAVEDWLDTLADAGMYVVLDMHQDVWGPFASDPNRNEDSDGAPEWATMTDGMPFVDFATMLGNWAFNYLSPDIMRAWDNFWDYDAHPELQDAYGAMWAHVADRFKDHPAVLGYDIMNEPWQGSGLLRYRQFDETVYTPFLQRVIDAIREADPEGWIFYEPNAFIANQAGPSYIAELADPRAGEARLAYFPHLYPLLIDVTGGYVPEVDHALPRWETLRTNEAAAHRVPVLAGEWSMLRWTDDANRALWENTALRMLERTTSGWTFWDCGFFLSGDEAHHARIASIYPRAVAGTPISYGYDDTTGVFTLVFRNREGTTGPTEIYLSEERNYPDGWTLDVSDGGDTWSWDLDETTGVMSIWTNPAEAEHTIVIAPAE